MKMTGWLMGVLLMGITAGRAAGADSTQTVHLKEYLNRTWSDELISYPLDKSLAAAKVIQVKDETGAALPCQVHEGRVYLLVTLLPNSEKTFTISAGESSLPAKPVTLKDEDGLLVLDSGVMAVRLPAGERTYVEPAASDKVPGPLSGVRGTEPTWIGKSWLEAPLKVLGHRTTVTARGPLWAEASIDYTFEGNKHYRFTVRAIAGQPYAVVNESMDLNPGGRYTLLKYDNDSDASTWEWWNLSDGEHLLPGEGRNEQPANAVFSFYNNLEPNQCRWTAGRPTHPRKGVDAEGKPTIMQEAGELYAPLTYEQDERFNRLTGWWLNSFSDRSYAFSLINDAQPGRPVVSLLMGRPSRNVNPQINPPAQSWIKILTGLNDMRIWTMKDKDLRVLAPICLGTREWLLMIEPQSALRPKGDKQQPNTFQTVLKHSWYPLEKIKDWSFDWPEPANAWPRIFCKAGDLPGMKARVAAATGAMATSPAIPNLYRTNATAEAMVKQALPMLEGMVRGAFCDIGPRGEGGHGSVNWFHASLGMMSVMPIWEAAMATPGIDPATRAKIKAYGAFVAQRAWDEDYWPTKETGNGWGSANMGTLAAGARVLTAAAMAGHPDQQRWLKRCRGYLDGNLQGLLAEDGSGVSCPHYLGASVDPTLYMALALKYGGSYDIFKKDPRWRKFGQFMIDILTPPDLRSPLGGPYYGLPLGAKLDPNARNRRNLWPLGHTSRTETSGIFDMLALGLAGVDEKLAGALRTMSAEQGANSAGGFVAYALIHNADTPLQAPDLHSRWYPSYGAILRDNRATETWLAIRYSKFAFDHFQADMGAFALFAKGMPLMMDFGSMYSPENGQPVYHNRVAWDVKEGDPKPCPGNQKEGCFYRGLTYFDHTSEPWTCTTEGFGEGQSPLDACGEAQSFVSLPEADYLVGATDVKTLQTLPYFPTTSAALAPDPNQKRVLENVPPFTWQRRLVFVKAQQDADPSYVLVRDDFTAPCPPPTFSYWVMANNLTFEGNRALATGQFGVDLDLYVAQPAKPILSKADWSHKNWGGETQVCMRVTQSEGKPCVALLYPRKAGEQKPDLATIADGNGVRITLSNETHWVISAPTDVTVTDGDLSFTGTACAVKKLTDGRVKVTLLAPGEVRFGKKTFSSKKPASRIL